MNPPIPDPDRTEQQAAQVALEGALSVLEDSTFGQKVLASKWTKIAIGLVASVAGLGWLVPLLRGSSTWEAKDAIVGIGFAGTLLGMLTSSGVAGVTRTAFLRKVTTEARANQAAKG